MELYASHDIPNGYGGGPAVFVADYLNTKPVDFGPALTSIELTICNDGPDVPHLWSGFAMPDSPTARYERKKKRLLITWPGTQHGAGEIQNLSLRSMSRDLFSRAADEIHRALSWAFAKYEGKLLNFDCTACLHWITTAHSIEFESDACLRREIEIRTRTRQTRLRRDALNKKAQIDWSRFHPDAAYFLPDPWLWSETDERAPHGNAIGVSILANWDRYASLDAEMAFEATALPEWSATLSKTQRANAVRAHIALLVAHLKITAQCPADIAQAAVLCFQSESSTRNSLWARRYKRIEVSALDQFIHLARPWVGSIVFTDR